MSIAKSYLWVPNLRVKTWLDMRPYLNEPKLPHFAAGINTQQLTTNARKTITCVQNGDKKNPPTFPFEMLDQSRLKFMKPMPPKPAPMKLATAFSGATQHRNAKDPNIGKTNSGRNCHNVIPPRTEKKTIICFREAVDGE